MTDFQPEPKTPETPSVIEPAFGQNKKEGGTRTSLHGEALKKKRKKNRAQRKARKRDRK